MLVNTVLLFAVLAFSVRSIADFRRERIPASLDRATACEVLNREVTTTWCEVRGDLVVYSANSHPVARVVVPLLLVSFANSVVLTWLVGANVGQLLLGLRVRRRTTAGRAGLVSVLLRWPLWPVATFGAMVVRVRHAVPVVAPAEPQPLDDHGGTTDPPAEAAEVIDLTAGADDQQVAQVTPEQHSSRRGSEPMEAVPVEHHTASGSPSPQGS